VHHILNNELLFTEKAAATYDRLLLFAKGAADTGVLLGNPDARTTMFRRLDRIAVEGMTPVKSRYDHGVSRNGRPSHESCHVVVMPEVGDYSISRQFRLVAIRLLMAHDEICVEKLPLQAIFRYHAGEQLMGRGEIQSGYYRAIAEEMLGWYYAVKIADTVLDEAGLERFSMPGPCTDGVMLGMLDHAAAVPAGELHRFARNQHKEHVIAASPFAPGLFIGNTYIGVNDIRPDQKALRDCWVQWRHAFAGSYQRGLERELWPFRKLSPPMSDDRIAPGAVAAVRAFLLDPRALRAMESLQTMDRVRGPSKHAEEDEPLPLMNVG
jgi:hypothetical protein